MKKNFDKKIKGFTLIELIIYVAVVAIIMVMLVDFTWNIIDGGKTVEISSEVTQNAKFVLNKITKKIRTAENIITGSSTFDSNPGVLVLDMPGSGTDITFDTYTKQVSVGTETVSIRTVRMQQGIAPAKDLTSNKVDVEEFIFNNYSRGTDAKNINFSFTINHVNPGGNSTYDRGISFQTSVTLRKK